MRLDIDKLKNKVPKENLFNLYITQNKGVRFCADYFNITIQGFRRLCKEYDIEKTEEQKNEAISTSNSRKETIEKSKQTRLEKYGDCNYNNREKAKQTCIEKYGVDNPFKSEQIKQKINESNIRSTGYAYSFLNEDIRQRANKNSTTKEAIDKRLATISKRGGYIKISEKIKATWREKYGVENISQAPHIAQKKSKKYKSEDGLTFDSSWELLVYNYCKRNNLAVERNIPIEYNYNNKKHTTFIDFKIDGYLFEVKGEHLLKGCFDYADNMVPISEKLKVYKENKVIIITNYKDLFGKANSTKSNGFRYPNKCKDPLIGVDINLFDNPDFPYREDRPKCFYDVRVDNNRSSYEAFQDESLRWEMIKNRIEYAGGFIDNKAILNAMNITRKCKQPSWFSKKFAKELITKYVTTDTVVDPFAGWGARNDACKELGINYIGIDFNKELVDWHKKCKRNIEYGDANTFTYDGECSVLICPPYQDVETYFEGQDLKTTQCEWLDTVMKNIPNAKEYIMVCKVVDKGWEKYIIETKGNKSHFGTNNEYILKVNNYGTFKN